MTEQKTQAEAQGGEPPASTTRDLENGIFNMVVTLTKQLSYLTPPDVARNYVASYLLRLAEGLKSVDSNNNDEGQTND